MEVEVEAQVRLRCVKEAGKLRIKVISKGYSPHANCQFPRNLRVEGKEFLVPASDVKIAQTAGKFFYRIGKNNIRELHAAPNGAKEAGPSGLQIDLSNLKVYEVSDNVECCICMETANELVVLAPCGHSCSCMKCSLKVDKCPICRAGIQQRVTRAELQ